MTSYTGPLLSKSRFLSGLQCPLRLWYQCFNRELAAPVTPAQQAIFDMGHTVGRLATTRFPTGVLIEEDYRHHDRSVASTQAALSDPRIDALFEAGFTEDDVRVRADILERRPKDRWNLIEVKSSTRVKEEHHTDVAIQLRVLRQAGLDIDQAYLMHLNRDYVYDGIRLDLEQLFSLSDLTGTADSLQEAVAADLIDLKGMLTVAEPPLIEPSRHCHSPHTCEFWAHCTRDKPPDWIFFLSGITRRRMDELTEQGIERIPDIPDTFPLTAVQRRIRDCVARSEEYRSPELGPLLRQIDHPIHFLDFETAAPAVPRYAGTRPFQTVPFQWSDHVLGSDGSLSHSEYLCRDDADPREEFTVTLLDAVGSSGAIVVYTTYEARILRELAEALPAYAGRLEGLVDRMVDLYAVIRNHYYHPAFHGSFSIKAVLPALLPQMDYAHLAVQDGTQASFAFLKMIDPETPAAERAVIREQLLEYCGHDTLAMVRVREALLERV